MGLPSDLSVSADSLGRCRSRGMGILNSMYYAFKPFLPLQFRYTIRRLQASYRLLAAKDWPIMQSAARPHPQWQGWPGGKQFALVLTHDVEGRVGWERCAKLA